MNGKVSFVMGDFVKWGAIIIGGWFVLRYLGGLSANANATIQPGMYAAPQWPYYPNGVVLLSQGLVGSVGSWQGPRHGVPPWRRPRP